MIELKKIQENLENFIILPRKTKTEKVGDFEKRAGKESNLLDTFVSCFVPWSTKMWPIDFVR